MALHRLLLSTTGPNALRPSRHQDPTEPYPEDIQEQLSIIEDIDVPRLLDLESLRYRFFAGRTLQHHHPPIHTGGQSTLRLLCVQNLATTPSDPISGSPSLLCVCMVGPAVSCFGTQWRTRTREKARERSSNQRQDRVFAL
jgi:hypothetical protein